MEDSIKDYADRIFENEGNEQQIILTKEEFTRYLRTAAEQYGDAGRDEIKAKPSLAFEQLRKANVARCEEVFHTVEAWSPAEWATAFAGEAGEVCNAVKKLRRLQDGTNTAKDPQTVQEAIAQIGKELADTIIYADLLGARLGIVTQNVVIDKFNEVSDRMECDIKLPLPEEPKTEQIMPSTDELRRTAEVLNEVMLHLEPKERQLPFEPSEDE